MLNIQKFVCNMFEENCYVVNDETGECVIIDCGAFYEEEKKAIADYIKDKKLTPKHLLCTHAHIDHNFGNQSVLDKFGLHPEVCMKDKVLMDKLREQALTFIGLNYEENIPDVKRYLSDNGIITFGIHSLKVISTPGHTPGSVFFYCEQEYVAFSGDTLFQMSIGRTDFEQGDYSEIINSLRKIKTSLPPDTVILPGHGGKTTLNEEIKYNPYFK